MTEKEIPIFDPQKIYDEELKKIMDGNRYSSGIVEKVAKQISEQRDTVAAMEFTRVICDMLKNNGVSIIGNEYTFGRKDKETAACYTITENYGVTIEGLDFSVHDAKRQQEIQKKETQISKLEKILEEYKESRNELADKVHELERELERKENAINQIDGIICELFGMAHNGDKYTEDFKELLRNQSVTGKTIVDFLPTEPIKVADMLINAEEKYERNAIEKAFYGNDKGTYSLFDISELRQIAEHLIVYCNHNMEEINADSRH